MVFWVRDKKILTGSIPKIYLDKVVDLDATIAARITASESEVVLKK